MENTERVLTFRNQLSIFLFVLFILNSILVFGVATNDERTNKLLTYFEPESTNALENEAIEVVRNGIFNQNDYHIEVNYYDNRESIVKFTIYDRGEKLNVTVKNYGTKYQNVYFKNGDKKAIALYIIFGIEAGISFAITLVITLLTFATDILKCFFKIFKQVMS